MMNYDEGSGVIHKSVAVGDIVQITNEGLGIWYTCLIIVTVVESWGVQGYMVIPNRGNAFIRMSNGDFEKVGRAIISIGDYEDTGGF